MLKQSKIQEMALSDDNDELLEVVQSIYDNIAYLSDKKQAWDTLIHLIQDFDLRVQYVHFVDDDPPSAKHEAAYILGSVFPYVPDKEHAQEDIHRLAQDNDSNVQTGAAYAIGASFQYFPDKKQAWEDLHRLTQDGAKGVRRVATKALGLSFHLIPDKNQVCEDLYRLSQDKDFYVRALAVRAIGIAFPYIQDKNRAWEHLHHLLNRELCEVVRTYGDIIYAIGIAFPYIPDKQKAWKDLHEMTEQWGGDHIVAEAIGIAFPYIPDKQQAWNDLFRLAESGNVIVVPFANYSLGRASIFRATEAESEENFRKELYNAIEFFENSLELYPEYLGIQEKFNSAKFCLSFYRAFYTIIFGKEYTEIEVKKYLADAKDAVEGSEIKEELLEAVENLANALKEMQKRQEIDYMTMKCNFNAYRRYCERSADFLNASENKAPGATKVIRKGLLIIDDRIKEIITEIQKNAEELCRNTKNTPLEELGKKINRIGTNLLQIRDPIGLEKNTDIFIDTLSAICTGMPEEERREACFQLQKAKDEQYIEDKIPLINVILSKIQVLITQAKDNEKIYAKLEQINGKQDKIIDYVQKIEFSCNQILSNLEKNNVKPAYRLFQ